MSEKELVTREKVEHNGLFSFSDLYSFMFKWLDEEDLGVVEKRYTESITGNARNIFFEWSCEKKLSDYYRMDFSIKVNVDNLTEVEVEIDGKKKKMNKGKIGVDIKGYLVIDYKGDWDSSPTTRWWRDVYNKYIVPKRVKAREARVFSTVVEFKEEIKAFLQLTGKR